MPYEQAARSIIFIIDNAMACLAQNSAKKRELIFLNVQRVNKSVQFTFESYLPLTCDKCTLNHEYQLLITQYGGKVSE